MSQTKALFCGCEHEFQDKIYGKNMRLHIRADKSRDYRCTVCNKSKINGAPDKKK